MVISSSEGLYSAQIAIESKDAVLKENLVVQSYSYCKSAETAIKTLQTMEKKMVHESDGKKTLKAEKTL